MTSYTLMTAKGSAKVTRRTASLNNFNRIYPILKNIYEKCNRDYLFPGNKCLTLHYYVKEVRHTSVYSVSRSGHFL